MTERKVQIFLYGAFANMGLLKKTGLNSRAFAPATLAGFELNIHPIANLVESGDGVIYGVLVNVTHAEIKLIEAAQATNSSAATFNPEPVIVRTRGGRIVPAITYLSTNLSPAPAQGAYIDMLLATAEKYGVPSWYRAHIGAFRQQD